MQDNKSTQSVKIIRKWHVINRFITINFFYSLSILISVILLCVWAIGFSRDVPHDTIIYFPIAWAMCVIFVIGLVFFGFNLYYCVKYLKHHKKNQDHTYFMIHLISCFIPFVGMIHELIAQVKLAPVRIQHLIIKKERKLYHNISLHVLRIIASILILLLGVLGTFVVSNIFVKYDPSNYGDSLGAGFKANIEDDRTSETKQMLSGVNYSAITYNVGFNAYNHDMHFFMDAPGHFLNGQSWAQSREAVDQSLNGIARVIGYGHDTNTINWNEKSVGAMNVQGVRDIYKSTYFDSLDTSTDKIGDWQSDSLIDKPYIDVDDSSYSNDSTSVAGEDGLFDFMSFEELDQNSTRSYYMPEYDYLRNKPILNNTSDDPNSPTIASNPVKDFYASVYAYNYVIPLVPVPLNQMHGQVEGGLCSFSKYTIEDSHRYALPSISGIMGLFQLRRCLIVNVIDTNIANTDHPELGNRKFVYITGHLDAYDKGGSVRRRQLEEVNKLFQTEYDKGNYVMMAADWNLTLPQTKGYEGNDMYDSNDVAHRYQNDNSIQPWEYHDFKLNGDVVNPSNSDWVTYKNYNEYNDGEVIPAGTICTFNSLNPNSGVDYVKPWEDPQQDSYNPNGYYGTDYGSRYSYEEPNSTEEYIALKDIVKNGDSTSPLINGGKNNDLWRYKVESTYRNVSLSQAVRKEQLPVAFADPESSKQPLASFFGNHAVPSLRDAGIRYAGDDSVRSEGDKKIYKANIDGFLVSNNIRVLYTNGYDNNFAYADHMPVSIKFQLRTN